MADEKKKQGQINIMEKEGKEYIVTPNGLAPLNPEEFDLKPGDYVAHSEDYIVQKMQQQANQGRHGPHLCAG